jgi:hypothetical protein
MSIPHAEAGSREDFAIKALDVETETFAEIEAIAATRGEVAILTPGTAGDDAILRVFSGK